MSTVTATATASASTTASETVIENEVVGGNELPMTFKVCKNVKALIFQAISYLSREFFRCHRRFYDYYVGTHINKIEYAITINKKETCISYYILNFSHLMEGAHSKIYLLPV